MADEPHYHSGGDSAPVKRKYDDSVPRRATGFSDGPPSSNSAPSYNNVPPPMDEIQIAKQRAQEIAARIYSSAEAKRPKFENGGSGWDSNDNSGFSSAPNDFGSTAPSVPSSYGYGNPSKKIEIPQGRVGVIIGKAGETIKYLQQQSGAKIQVTRDMDADPHSLTREVELTGSEESIEKAERLIKDVLAEAESGGSGTVSRRVSGQSGGAEQFVMQIPSRKVGLVIGKGGETIKNFQASTGARIQVIPLHPPPGDTSTERTVQIDGTSDQIEAAKQLVNEVISENRQRNSMGSGYSQQGYQARPPGQQMQQQDYYGYAQPGAYPGQQAQYTQQPYASYPQQAAGGYATSWDQSSGQQTAQGGGGYDYYGQQQSQQTQPPSASTPANATSYGYGQQGQGYGQEGYGGYASAPQSGYGQQHGYSNPTPGYNSAGQTTDGQNAAYGGQGDNASQAPPTSAPQSGYSQPPGPNSNYPPQGASQPGYGAPPTSQPEYGTPGYGGYGPPPTQKPPAYGQQPQQSPNAASVQTGYSQPGYGAPPAYGTAGYAQPPYGAPPVTQPGYGSYGGGYQPPAYSADPAVTAAPPTQVAQSAPKASPQQN
uniref:far upstream element-binding protein 2-like n=1 Tax=Erigeron canadensis TaxID=72917 RepID=UPI001CB9455E|nr:far upstream element-binding protein 2-like [Erigeron canadensis]